MLNTNSFEEQEIEIDLLDLFWRYIEQWRALLVAGLLVMVIGLGISATRAVLISPELEGGAVASEDSADTEGIIDEEADTLDVDSEYQLACTAISQYANYQILKESYSKTILGNYDFTDCNYVNTIYEFSVSGDNKNLLVVSNLYSYMSDNGDFNETLVKIFDEDVDPNSIYDIVAISVSANTNDTESNKGTISISVKLPQSIDEDSWQSALNTAIREYYDNTVNATISHSLKKIATNSRTIDGKSIIQMQNNKLAEISSAKNTFDDTLKSLNEVTRDLIEDIIKEQSYEFRYEIYKLKLDESWEENVSKIEAALEEERLELERQQEESETAAADEADTIEENPITVAKVIKWMVLFFILGVVLYCMGYMAWFILYRVFRDDAELATLIDIRDFGGIYQYPYDTKWARFIHDERIYGIRHKKGRSSSVIVDDLLVKMDYSKVEALTVIVAGSMKDNMKSIVDSQMDFLKGKGKTIGFLNTADLSNSYEDSAFADIDNAFLVLIGGKTKYSDAAKLFAKFKEYDVKAIGYEYLEM